MTILAHSINTQPRISDKETPMETLDLLARVELDSIRRETDRERRQRRLARDAIRAQRHGATPSRFRRARIRLGEALVSVGLAIAGPAEDGAPATHLVRPA